MSLDVARAFAFHAAVSGDLEFLRDRAWPVLSGVATWVTSRVTKTDRGYEIRAAMGIAEREEESDNDGIVLPEAGRVIVSHDGFDPGEEKGGTPDPLMGVFPLGFDMDPEVEAATLKWDLREGYIGSPVLSALYGVWAAYSGDRRLSAQLMEDGYGQFCVGRFEQTLEYREDV